MLVYQRVYHNYSHGSAGVKPSLGNWRGLFLFKFQEPIEKNFLKIIDFGLSCKYTDGQVLQTKACQLSMFETVATTIKLVSQC